MSCAAREAAHASEAPVLEGRHQAPRLLLAAATHLPTHSPHSLTHRPAPPTCSVANMAWPMCSLPVTLGGGIEMTYGSPAALSSGLK